MEPSNPTIKTVPASTEAFDRWIFTLRCEPPRYATYKTLCVQFQFEKWYVGALDKLPRNREIPWEVDERRRAAIQERDRERIAEDISRRMVAELREKILEYVRSRDTQNGYEPDER